MNLVQFKPDLFWLQHLNDPFPSSLHSSFAEVKEKLKKWVERFPYALDESVVNNLHLFYHLASNKFLNHRNPKQLFHLLLSLHLVQKKLLQQTNLSPHSRHLQVRWIPAQLSFPFSSKSVLGCLIGLNLMDRYEIFDEENIFLALQKHLPQLNLVKESTYDHTTQHKNLKNFYFELEKKDGTNFSLQEQKVLRNNLEEKIKNSIQELSPKVFMGLNEEETYKHVLFLNREIQSPQDLPQAYILFEQQTGQAIVFRIILVYCTPSHKISLKERFFDCSFTLDRVIPIRRLENHLVEAHIFRLFLSRDSSFLRSDGSLDFHAARQKVSSLLTSAIGEFRDYNGGLLFKQRELLLEFKNHFADIASQDPECIDNFFYSITPLEKQVLLSKKTLVSLFTRFLENRKEKFSKDSFYSFKTYRSEGALFLTIHSHLSSLSDIIAKVMKELTLKTQNMVYNILDLAEGIFFNCVFLPSKDLKDVEKDALETESLIQTLQEVLLGWRQKISEQQVLRVGLDLPVASLDPRIGGESVSSTILHLLFEGLTRLNQDGSTENALAESIEVSPNLKQYIFKIKTSYWNDGSLVSAYDFEYAWKKILSPDFKTSFATFFYPIQNAKEAKEGKVPSSQIGIHAVDSHTLKVELIHPTPYFLELTAHPLFSPVHHLIDQRHPQWPYQSGKNYPCNGPFQLKINRSHEGYHLIRNPFYWDDKQIKLDQIILTQMSPAQAFHSFQKKELDWIGRPFGTWHPFYSPGKEDQLISLPNHFVVWWVFNTNNPLLQNKKLRQAFSLAIQRSQIVEGFFTPLYPTDSPLPSEEDPVSLFVNPKNATENIKKNREKAELLLQEALQELQLKKEDFPPIELSFYQKSLQEYTAQHLKNQLKDFLGIECVLKPFSSWSNFFQKTTTGEFQTSLMLWSSGISGVRDSIYTLNAFRFADGDLNFSKWKHPEFQKLLDLSDQEINPFQRTSYLLQAENMLRQELPVIPLFEQPQQALVSKNLCNVRASFRSCNFSRSFFRKEV